MSTINGIWENGLSTNGIWENGIWENGIWENGIWENGFGPGGVWSPGVWLGGIWRDAIWQTNPSARATLRDNRYAGQLLQYIYGCAMPAAAHRTLDAGDGVKVDLQGAIGLWPTWDVCTGSECSAWNDAVAAWRAGMDPVTVPDGECNETCQRWITACVLARTNAYGEHVEISMRAPEDAPLAIVNALATTTVETETFTKREGAYYGNLFQTYRGSTGRTVGTPVLFACAGPDSNIPDITRRFCSSQGASGVITNTGICQATDGRTGACEDPADTEFPTEHDCAAPASGLVPATSYNEVITVYLRDSIAVCGNSVCEEGESPGAPGECLTDCHPVSWAKSFDNVSAPPGMPEVPVASATGVAPDRSVVVATAVHGSVPFDYSDDDVPGGDDVLDATGIDHWDLVIVKYDPDGHFVWGRRIAQDARVKPGAIAIVPPGVEDSVGRIAIVGDCPECASGQLWVGTFGFDGLPDHDQWRSSGGTAVISVSDPSNFNRAGLAYVPDIDGDGHRDLVLAASFGGKATFGTGDTVVTLTTPSISTFDSFVLAMSPDGSLKWAVSLHGVRPGEMELDRAGNIVLGVIGDLAEHGRIVNLDKASGSVRWEQDLPTAVDESIGVAVEPGMAPSDGYVYVTGKEDDSASGSARLYLAKYDNRDGSREWLKYSGTVAATPPAWARLRGLHLAMGANDEVILSGEFETHDGALVDFGGGRRDSYASADGMVIGYDTGGHPRWVKHIPHVLSGMAHSLEIDAQGQIVLSGVFNGSMTVDDHLLVNGMPELPDHPNVFVASFPPPGRYAPDITPPTIGPAPGPFHVHATSPAGAPVWYMPPTAVDVDNAGVSVYCDPAPSSVFPIGTTTVVCTATDPFGHTASNSFPVTVGDELGPSFSVTPVNASATSSSGATVSYPLPTATDQVTGPTAVACTPASGSMFPLGITLVTCTSTDGADNTTTHTFPVTITDNTPPVLYVPTTLTVPATMPGGTAVVDYPAFAYDAVDGMVGIDCTPPSGSVFQLDTTIVHCSATDAAGNHAETSFTVWVQAEWTGILQPVNSDGSSIFVSSSTVPIRFALKGASANITNLEAKLSVSRKSYGVSGTVYEAKDSTPPDSGNVFHYDQNTHQYVYNLAASSLTKGDWLLSIDLKDGVKRTVKISVVK